MEGSIICGNLFTEKVEGMNKKVDNILQLIGSTPLVKLQRVTKELEGVEMLAKLEMFNPASSVKDRIAYSMIKSAEEEGKIKKDTIILEPTSGNTGIGLAMVCAVKGYKLILVMPESMSIERRKLLKLLGAEILLTPATEGMKGAVRVAKEMAERDSRYFIPDQFANPSNPQIHYQTTALEIWEATEGKVEILVGGIGTGGTITGCGRFLKEKNADIKIIGVEPASSPVISGGVAGTHKIQGIGAGFIPAVLDLAILDKVITVSNEEAFRECKRLAKEEGMLVGISSGAALAGAIKIAKDKEIKGKTIVVIFPDTAERYLSVEELFD